MESERKGREAKKVKGTRNKSLGGSEGRFALVWRGEKRGERGKTEIRRERREGRD